MHDGFYDERLITEKLLERTNNDPLPANGQAASLYESSDKGPMHTAKKETKTEL
jgi:hypothetical protein